MEAHQHLKRCEKGAVWALGVGIVLFGALTIQRSVFLSRRMGDVGVFFRAGWAAREAREQLYTITCDNDWHYCYPPLFSCLFMPFADPPPGAAACASLPFAPSVAVWYLISVLLLGIGLHLLAGTLEASEPGGPPPVYSRRWWSLRTVPLFVCLPCIGSTLVRGQVTPVVFVLICASLVSSLRGLRLGAGLWLAAAVCVKIFPGFLAIGPLVQRDRRCLAGLALGLVLGVAILPTAVFGPKQTVDYYRQYVEILIYPALGLGDDQSRAEELINSTATGSQALVSAINSILQPDRATRAPRPAPLASRLHWLLGACMTVVTLWAFRRSTLSLSRTTQSQRAILFGGSLVLIMMLICPVCHLHYLMLTLPVVMALVAIHRGSFVYPGKCLCLLFTIHLVTVVLAQLPGLEMFKDKCIPTYGVLLLWVVACETGRQLGAQALDTPARLVTADVRAA